MKMFGRKEKTDYSIIIGCGRLGGGLANVLSDEGHEVLIIDCNKESFLKLSSSYVGLTLIGDATDIDILSEAQVEKATAVIVVTNNDNTNIIEQQVFLDGIASLIPIGEGASVLRSPYSRNSSGGG
jgi:trk system potassium uptake protein